MMIKFYSPSMNGFYSPDINGDNIPDDSVKITDVEWFELLDGQSKGKVITADENGNPILKDYPKPTSDELKAIAELEKIRLLSVATTVISPLQDAADLGIATEQETASLKIWKTYRVMINRVDTGNPVWPVPPNMMLS